MILLLWESYLNNIIQKLKRQGYSHPIFTSFVFIILGINLFAHRPIQIINAVSLKPDINYSLHLNSIRYFLEPIVGFPLFYLRSGDPVEEYIVLWIWIFFCVGVYFIYSYGIKFYEKWLLSIPAILGLAYFILVWMIFWPLPSNTIVNESKSKILFNTHAHSYFSHDGLITPAEQMNWHKNNGFDAFFLTEHNHNLKTLDLVQQQRNGQLTQNPHVMAGIEYSGSNHMVLLGLTDSLITFGKKDSVVIPEVHRQGGVVGVAHWFDGQKMSINYYINLGVNGYEIVNKNQLAYPKSIHHDIIDACENNKMFLLGGADYHGYGPTCGTWNVLDIFDWQDLSHVEKTESIMNGLKDGKNQVIYYSDRNIISFENIWLSPLLNIMNYFKGLNIFQIISWIGWGVLFISLGIKINKRFILQWVPLITGSIIIIKGRILLEKSISVVQQNDVLVEFGDLFTVIGCGFILSGIIVWGLLKKFPSIIPD